MTRRSMLAFVCGGSLGIGGGCGVRGGRGARPVLRNVSYDATRELYADLNRSFQERRLAQGKAPVQFEQSHASSGKQARSIIGGLETDIVTLALAFDIDAIARRARLLPVNWQHRLPNNSCPFVSTVVFLVRKGNPKQIRDWQDLTEPGVSVITPSPKSSGGARWSYLAAWGAFWRASGGDLNETRRAIAALYRNVPVLDAGTRAATTTFVRRRIGDVLLSWENEARLAAGEFDADGTELVTPRQSILAEPPVALLDALVDRRGTRQLAEQYLEFLYSKEAQRIAVRHHLRPTLEEVKRETADRFATLELFTIDQVFGDWEEAHRRHFAAGGEFDRIVLGGS